MSTMDSVMDLCIRERKTNDSSIEETGCVSVSVQPLENEKLEAIQEEASVSGNGEENDEVLDQPGPTEENCGVICRHDRNADECCQNGDDDPLEDGQSSDTEIISRTPSISVIDINEHCHDGTATVPAVDKEAFRKLFSVVLLGMFFMTVKLGSIAMSTNLSILTEGVHSIADLVGYGVGVFAVWLAAKPSSKHFNFGWYRAEVIGALACVLMIWIVTAVLAILAVGRLINEDYNIDATRMQINAAIGILGNTTLAITLKFETAFRKWGPAAYQATAELGSGLGRNNIVVEVAFVHVLCDYVQNLGILVAATVISNQSTAGIVDPICALISCAFAILATTKVTKDILYILMEGAPKSLNYLNVKRSIRRLNGVICVHDLKMWSLNRDKTAMTVHVVMAMYRTPLDMSVRIARVIKQDLDIHELTLVLEEYSGERTSCHLCEDVTAV